MPRRVHLLVTIVAGVAALGVAVAHSGMASRPSQASRAGSANGALPSLWPAPRFSLVDQAGRIRSSDELRGSVWIADFIFTHCSSVCPVVTAKMVQVQRAVRDPRVRFVSFSVDPDRDTPEALREYARRWAPDETRWTLLATTKETLAEVVAGMKTWVQPQSDANAELHTNELFLVDAQGRVRGLYDTADVVFTRLVPHAQRLLAELDGPVPPAPATAAGNGAALYRRLGCAGCHEAPSIAPSLAGIAGRAVMLAGGGTVTADAAYLRESILEPGAKVVATYPAIMPSYRSQLSESELASLVQYLQSWSMVRAAAASTPKSGPGAAIDPVCGMQVHPGRDTPQLRHQGETIYFCSDNCRHRFAARPRAVNEARPGIGN